MTANAPTMLTGVSDLRKLIRDVPDFPNPGVVFKDITPLLASPAGLALSVEYLAQPFRGKGVEYVLGAESRGFVFGTAVAQALSAGFVPARKPGKLPREVYSCSFDLEYGSDSLEIHVDSFGDGDRVLIIDDVMATGGTLAACCQLVRDAGATVFAVGVLIELTDLNGRSRLTDCDVISVLRY